MGPPPRPNAAEKAEKEEKEKITDISDISDVIFGSGVDLREEENYMTNTFRNSHAQSFNSFDSGTTIASTNNSFNLLTQGGYGNQSAFAGSGPTSQLTQSQESIEAELNRKHKAAALEYARKREHHLRDPFLQGNTVRHRMHKIALEQGVALDIKGLFEPNRGQAPTPQPVQITNGVTAVAKDGNGIAAIRAQSTVGAHALLEDTSRYADLLSLVSLAANERMRDLLDEAYTIARGRRYGSHGVVPPDLQDLADGENMRSTSVVPISITGTSWDQLQDGEGGATSGRGSRGLFAPYSFSRDFNVDNAAEPEPTVSFSSSISTRLQSLAVADRDAELARIRKRQERAQRATSASLPPTAPGDPDTPMANAMPGGTSTPGTPSGEASQIAPEKPMTKKERERQAKMGQTEEVLHKNANVTAAMQLGLGKKKKYSWMTGGAAAQPTNPFARPAPKIEPVAAASPVADGSAGDANGISAASANGKVAKPAPAVERGMQAKERKWGSWREDGVEGRGIQIRDWALVLERDGREKRALQRTLLNLDKGAASAE